MPAKLLTFSLSHPARGTAMALALKGIDFKTKNLMPGLHALTVRGRGYSEITVPALEIDGEKLQGSLAIVQWLERNYPEPSLYPRDPDERAAVEQAEAWGESELQPIPRRIFRRVAILNQNLRRWMASEIGLPLPGLAGRTMQPTAVVMAAKVGATAEAAQADVKNLPATLDRADALVEAGVIGGPQLNAADLQILTTVRSLMTFTDLAQIFQGRPVTEAATRVVEPMPGPVPPVIPAEWLK